MKVVDWWTISDSGLSNSPLARRPVVGYLNRSMMASNRLCNTSIICHSLSFKDGLIRNVLDLKARWYSYQNK